MRVERNIGREENSDEPEGNGIRQEQIEKVLERNMRLLWDRKERDRAIWEDSSRGRMNGVIATDPLPWLSPDDVAVDVDHKEVSK